MISLIVTAWEVVAGGLRPAMLTATTLNSIFSPTGRPFTLYWFFPTSSSLACTHSSPEERVGAEEEEEEEQSRSGSENQKQSKRSLIRNQVRIFFTNLQLAKPRPLGYCWYACQAVHSCTAHYVVYNANGGRFITLHFWNCGSFKLPLADFISKSFGMWWTWQTLHAKLQLLSYDWPVAVRGKGLANGQSRL